MKKDQNGKKKMNEYDLGIVFSIVGIIASIGVIALKLFNKENIAIGILLLIACIGMLVINIKQKKDNKTE
jgi:hypothetical protein